MTQTNKIRAEQIAGQAWTSWTPTISSSSGTITTKSATGYYKKIGKIVNFYLTVTITTNGTGAGSVIFTLPINAIRTGWIGVGRENAVTGHMLQVTGGVDSCAILKYENSYPGLDGASLLVSGTYEAA